MHPPTLGIDVEKLKSFWPVISKSWFLSGQELCTMVSIQPAGEPRVIVAFFFFLLHLRKARLRRGELHHEFYGGFYFYFFTVD